MLVLVRSFFYIPYASFSEEMVLASFLYTPDASFSEEMNKLTSLLHEGKRVWIISGEAVFNAF